MQNENVKPLVQKSLRISRCREQSVRSSVGPLRAWGPRLVPRLCVQEADSDWSVDHISARLGSGFGKGKLSHSDLYHIAPTQEVLEKGHRDRM